MSFGKKKKAADDFQQLQQAFPKVFCIKGQQHKRVENSSMITLTDRGTLYSVVILEKSLSPD